MEKNDEKIVEFENKEDEDLDYFEELEDELEETKKEPKKINWKRIALYFSLTALGFIIGRGRRRYVPVTKKDNVFVVVPNSANWSRDQIFAAEQQWQALDDVFYKNHLVVCRDRKKRKNSITYDP